MIEEGRVPVAASDTSYTGRRFLGLHPVGISAGTSFHRRVSDWGTEGLFSCKGTTYLPACGLFGIKPGVPRIPPVIASPDAHAGERCIFGPRHGINSKNPYYHPSTHNTASPWRRDHLLCPFYARSVAAWRWFSKIVSLVFTWKRRRFHRSQLRSCVAR